MFLSSQFYTQSSVVSTAHHGLYFLLRMGNTSCLCTDDTILETGHRNSCHFDKHSIPFPAKSESQI